MQPWLPLQADAAVLLVQTDDVYGLLVSRKGHARGDLNGVVRNAGPLRRHGSATKGVVISEPREQTGENCSDIFATFGHVSAAGDFAQ